MFELTAPDLPLSYANRYEVAAEIILRDYQIHCIDEVRLRFQGGDNNVLVCAPTGAGKTVIASRIIKDARAKGRKVAFVVDRLSLIAQTSTMLDLYGIPHGIIQGKHDRHRPWEFVQICSIHTLNRRGWADFDLVLIDECHTVYKSTKQHLLKREVPTIGLTATPFAKGLGQQYDGVVNVTTTDKLIKQGFLSTFRILSAVEPDMTGVKVVAGEWDEKETSKRALKIVGDVVKEYLEHGNDQKFICSAVDIAHAEELCRQFVTAGQNCVTYTSKTSEDEREAIATEFRRSDSSIKGLVTVTAATKGFDVPDIGVVIIARPLRNSLAELIQLIGRGLRISEGKLECIILDHTGNCMRFWEAMFEFFAKGVEELDDGQKKEPAKKKPSEAKEPKKCPACHHLHHPAPSCPHCGYEYPVKKTEVKHVAGSMKELISSGDREAITKSLWVQVCSYATAKHPTDYSRAKRLAYGAFKGITKVYPTEEFQFDMSVPVSVSVRNKIQQNIIAYFKGKQRSAA